MWFLYFPFATRTLSIMCLFCKILRQIYFSKFHELFTSLSLKSNNFTEICFEFLFSLSNCIHVHGSICFCFGDIMHYLLRFRSVVHDFYWTFLPGYPKASQTEHNPKWLLLLSIFHPRSSKPIPFFFCIIVFNNYTEIYPSTRLDPAKH